MLDKQVLAPGIILYKTDKTFVQGLKEKIEDHLQEKWRPAQVVNTDTYENEVSTLSRKCFDYSIDSSYIGKDKEIYDLSNSWISPKINDFSSTYQIENLLPGPYIYLKYGFSDKFDWHIDDGGKFPRTVSVSAYLNDDYEGGNIEFSHFNISHKPEAGDVIVFGSSFTYMHRVTPVIYGTRYAIVNWYRYSTMPQTIGG